jgi:dTMP kinase
MQSKVIMFDGPDGVGKTTQLTQVQQRAEAKGLKVFSTRVLGGTDFGEELRTVILGPTRRVAEADMHIILSMAANLGHELDQLREDYDLILIDRSHLSFLGFQVAGSGLDERIGAEAAAQSARYTKPDLVCVYDAPLEVLQQRRPTLSQKGAGDYFEDKDLDFHQRVIEGYRKAIQTDSHARLVDASESTAQVLTNTLAVIKNELGIDL